MARYAVFLRGMNVGGHRITNDELCARFADLGLAGATAFLASGNVVFEADGAATDLLRRIEDGLRAALGYEVPAFLRSAAEVRRIAARQPFDAARLASTSGRIQVALLPVAPRAAARRRILDLETADDRLAIHGSELYWLPRGGLSDSELDLATIGAVTGAMTIRTHRTLVRLAARFFAA